MQLELLNDQGQGASKLDVPETVFGREYKQYGVSRKNNT